MEDAPRGAKRARAHTGKVAEDGSKADGSGGENLERSTSDASEKSADRAERGPFPDDFEENLRGTKRNRVAEGASGASVQTLHQSLIEVVKGNGKFIPHAVKLWVERYEKNSKLAMAELLTMLFEICGANYYIKAELLDETDVDDVVVALVNLARRGELNDYQSSKKKEFKSFKQNVISFWDNLVAECQDGPLFDNVLFDKCMDYIIALSCTPPRIYRQIASLMGLQLVTSFISVAKMFGSQRETTQRQLNAEKKKRADGPRFESLNKRLSITHDKITALEDMMRKIFTGLFVHRYRDVDPAIRMSCIEALGVWVLSYPSLFLQDLYLKYLGWTLNDKSAGVRKASVLALQNLYEADENVPTLDLFTQRFSNRMIELANDIDVSVALCAIGLVKQLLRHQLIPDDDLGAFYDLLIDDPPEIRRAIGELVYDHLIAQKFSNSQSGLRGRTNDSSEVHISRLLHILREFSADPILSTYVIDGVWDYMKAMKDWKCIIAMLLDENPRVELTDEDTTNLIRLLFASAKKATGERIVPAIDNRKQYHSKAQKEAFENNRRDVTVAMLKNYPQLLRKFMADKAKVSSLVEIILHMKLELYSLKRQEQHFKTLLQLIKDAFFKHGEKEALRSCAKAITFCASESKGELQDFSRNKLKEIEDELLAKLKLAVKEVEDGNDEYALLVKLVLLLRLNWMKPDLCIDLQDGNDEYALLVNLKRLYELHLLKPVPIESIYEDIVATLHKSKNLDEEVIEFLLLNLYLHMAWSLHSVINSESVSEASLSSLLLKRNTLLEELGNLLNSSPGTEEGRTCGNQLASRICSTLSEVWCLFRKSNFAATKVEKLGYCPDIPILEKFWKFCEKQLNLSDDIEEDANGEYIEDTNCANVMIAAAKLVVTNTVSKDYLGPEIISHFALHGNHVADIVKYLIAALKKREDDISGVFLESLKRAYDRYVVEHYQNNDESANKKAFEDCKDLAVRLSMTFAGAARTKHRPDVLKIVKEGIEYAFIDAPKQLTFLECAVLPFVSRLPTPDIMDILKQVQKRIERVNTDEDPSGWRPYFTFVDILREKIAKNEDLQDNTENKGVRRRGRPRKQRNNEGKRLFDEQSASEDESISRSDHETAQEDEDDENAPLIQTFRSSRLRSLRTSREENRGLSKG